MKLRTRLAIAFLIITVVPMAIFSLSVVVLSSYQARIIFKRIRINRADRSVQRQFHADI